jgi:hypothetical protein
MTKTDLLSKLQEALDLADSGYRTAVARYEDWSDSTVDRTAELRTASSFSSICSSIEKAISEAGSLS